MSGLDPIKLSYIAGYFDGDGSVNACIFKTGRHAGEIRVEMNISSRVREPIETIHNWLGFGYLEVKRRSKPIYVFRVNTQEDMLRFINLILPYSITRRRQLELMKEYLESRLRRGRELISYERNGRVYRIPQRPPYSEREIQLIKEIQRLNREGE